MKGALGQFKLSNFRANGPSNRPLSLTCHFEKDDRKYRTLVAHLLEGT
jgi:hypothetical protein